MHINTRFSARQQVFLDFVFQHYISVGVEELDQEKLTPLLLLKYYNSLADTVADLGGRFEEINKAFSGSNPYSLLFNCFEWLNTLFITAQFAPSRLYRDVMVHARPA